MKLYADNLQLAGHLLETAFALLRNEGQDPVDTMLLAYDLLVDGIDVSTAQQVALHDYLRKLITDHDSQHLSGLAKGTLTVPSNSRGGSA